MCPGPRPRKSALSTKLWTSSQTKSPRRAGRKATKLAATTSAGKPNRTAVETVDRAKRGTLTGSRGSERPSVSVLAEQASHLARVEGVLDRVVLAEDAAVDEGLERALHRDHARRHAGLQHGLDLEGLGVADQVADG